MPDLFLNQINIKSVPYSIYDSRLAENNNAIVAAETVYIGTKADGNVVLTASQVSSAISSAISTIATDRISNNGGMLSVDSSGNLSTSGVGGIYLAADDITLQGQGGGQSLTMNDDDGAVAISATALTFNGEDIATQPYVTSAIANALTDTMTYRQAVTSATSPILAVKGDVFAAASTFSISGTNVESGDMIIVKASIASGATFTDANVDVVQKNLDGAVTGPASATANHVAVFDGNTGKVIKDGTYTIAKSVPADAVFTDTTYSAGNGLSLSSTTFNVISATSSTFGGIKIGYADSGDNVAVQLDENGKAYVTVPAFPSAADGIVLNEGAYRHTNSITAGSAGVSTAQSGTTFSVPYVAYDAQGHITSAVTAAVTIPVMGGATTQASGTAGLVPAPSAGHEGEFLRADGTWSAPTFTIPAANANTLGGIKLGYSTVASTGYYAVQADENNNAYVNVLQLGAGEGLSFASSDWSLNVISATSSAFGGIKLGYTQSDADGQFAVQLDEHNKAYVKAWSLGDGLSCADGILSVPTFAGATASGAGTAGLVPIALSSQTDCVLLGNGNWASIAYVSGNTLML